jgi:hypothetical protein
MISKNIQKGLSVTVMTAFLTLYSAPAGICIAAVSQIDTGIGIQKPLLRENNQPTSLKLEGDVSISKANPKVTLSLRNSDVKQVLRMFADKAGLNIIFHSSVDVAGGDAGSSGGSSTPSGPKVTMDLVNVPLNDAFKMVMQVANLTYYLDNNTLIIADAKAALKLDMAKQELMIIPVKYVDAGSMANFLNKNVFSINKPGLSNGEIAVTNPETNEILIFGTKNDYLMAKKVITQFDKKPLEETFVVNHTTPKEMATLICNTLLKLPSSGGGGATGGAASISGVPTGGAAAASGGGDLSLGAGTQACQYNNSVTANNLASLSTNNLTVSYFPQKGTITAVGGSAQQLELIKDFIAKNDKKQPQAYMEISIIELNESGSKAFNNTWNVWWNNCAFTFDGQTATNSMLPTFFQGNGYATYDTSSYDPITGYKIKNLYQKATGNNTIAYTMSYLIKNGKGRVLANPRILITNGQTSKIDLVSDYVSKVDASQAMSNGVTQTAYTYTIASDNGIQIELTPYISPDGYVTLNIKPQYATIAEKVPGSGTLTSGLTVATLLNKRNLDLKNIRIKDGETLTIGGLINEEEQKNVSKFPVLGDLPGIGMFFRNTDSTKVRHELVIMITPKIIKDSEDVVSNPNMTL